MATTTRPVGRAYAKRNVAHGRTDQYGAPTKKLADGTV